MLAATKPGAKLIGERFVAKKLPRDFFPQVTEALKKFGDDPAIAKLQAEVLRGGLLALARTGSDRQDSQARGRSRATPKKGRELYLNTKLLACATCHRMEGVGGSVGPDLTRVWDTMTLEKILESIVDPSKEIKEGFQTYRLATTGEQIITGLKIKEDDKEVVIRDANGRDSRVAKSEIESLAPSKVSLMPDNVVAQISYEQFIDLLAFLKSRKEQESLRGLVAEVGVTGPFPGDLKSSEPEVKNDAKWQTLHAEPNGIVNLASVLSGPDSAVYARAYIHSPKQQKATVQAQVQNPYRLWVNGTSVAASTTSSSGTKFEAELKKGWNVLLVKIANRGKSATLGVRVAGEELRTAGTPDELPVAAGGAGR